MTSLEDRLREAFRGEARDIPPGAVPPLRLPGRRRRFFSLAYGGGERKEAPAAWRGWLPPVAAAAVVAAVIAGAVAVSRAMPGPGSSQQAAAAAASEAAAWIENQVSRSARVSCDPVMCRNLAAHRIRAADLNVLRPDAASPLGSDVIVATAAVRREFGGRLSSVYAPVILASFGSGAARVDIRVIASQGAAAYRSELRADLRSRKMTGTQLSNSSRIAVSAAASRRLRAGLVDSRVLTVLTGLAAIRPISLVSFGDSGPGASPGVPLRAAELAIPGDTGSAGRPASLRAMLAQLTAQRPPYRPARAGSIRLRDGRVVLRIQFAAPSPLGLLGTASHSSS